MRRRPHACSARCQEPPRRDRQTLAVHSASHGAWWGPAGVTKSVSPRLSRNCRHAAAQRRPSPPPGSAPRSKPRQPAIGAAAYPRRRRATSPWHCASTRRAWDSSIGALARVRTSFMTSGGPGQQVQGCIATRCERLLATQFTKTNRLHDKLSPTAERCSFRKSRLQLLLVCITRDWARSIGSTCDLAGSPLVRECCWRCTLVAAADRARVKTRATGD